MNDDLVTELRILSGSRKLYPSAPHGQMVGMETYKIVATGFALECIDAASDEIESLLRQLAAATSQRDGLNHLCEFNERTMGRLIQQLAAAQETLKDHGEIQAALCQQLADSQKREVMLRGVLEESRSSIKFDLLNYEKRVRAYGNIGVEGKSDFGLFDAEANRLSTLIDKVDEALAATADLEGLVLCEGEPVCIADPLDIAKDGNYDTFIVKHYSEWHEALRFKIPLYRAREQKP